MNADEVNSILKAYRNGIFNTTEASLLLVLASCTPEEVLNLLAREDRKKEQENKKEGKSDV